MNILFKSLQTNLSSHHFLSVFAARISSDCLRNSFLYSTIAWSTSHASLKSSASAARSASETRK